MLLETRAQNILTPDYLGTPDLLIVEVDAIELGLEGYVPFVTFLGKVLIFYLQFGPGSLSQSQKFDPSLDWDGLLGGESFPAEAATSPPVLPSVRDHLLAFEFFHFGPVVVFEGVIPLE